MEICKSCRWKAAEEDAAPPPADPAQTDVPVAAMDTLTVKDKAEEPPPVKKSSKKKKEKPEVVLENSTRSKKKSVTTILGVYVPHLYCPVFTSHPSTVLSRVAIGVYTCRCR